MVDLIDFELFAIFGQCLDELRDFFFRVYSFRFCVSHLPSGTSDNRDHSVLSEGNALYLTVKQYLFKDEYCAR